MNQEDYVQDLVQRFSDIQGTSEVPCLKEEEIEPKPKAVEKSSGSHWGLAMDHNQNPT